MISDWLEYSQLGLMLITLGYASYCDLKSREVSDYVWIVSAPIGLLMTSIRIYYSGQMIDVLLLLISLVFMTFISLLFYYFNFFGGADVKANVTIALSIPTPPKFSPVLFGKLSPIFNFTVFSNTALLSASMTIFMLLYNIIWKFKTGKPLFEGLQHEPLWKKIVTIATGFKIKPHRLTERFLHPLEEIIEDSEGNVTRSLNVLVKAEDVGEIEADERLEGEIWVTPGLPLIVFMFIALIISVLFGDILLWSFLSIFRLTWFL